MQCSQGGSKGSAHGEVLGFGGGCSPFGFGVRSSTSSALGCPA